jgi:type II secretion system protein N
MMALLKAPEEWKTMLAWTGAGLGALVLSLLATFPYDALHARMMAELHRATGLDVRVADWSVGVPFSVEWRQVTLSNQQIDPIQVSFLQAKMGMLKALAGGLGVDVVVHLDENSPNTGLAKATMTASSFSMAGPVTVKGQLQQVDLSKLVGRYVTHGLLNGDFSHRANSASSGGGFLKGEGTWKADVKDVTVDHIPVGGGRTLALTFSRVSAGITCRDAVCDVNELKGDGIDGSFTAEGKITLQQPVQQSQLALTMTVVPGAGFTAKAGTLGLPPLPPGTPMTFKIQGTMAQARIAL